MLRLETQKESIFIRSVLWLKIIEEKSLFLNFISDFNPHFNFGKVFGRLWWIIVAFFLIETKKEQNSHTQTADGEDNSDSVAVYFSQTMLI